MPFHPDVMSFLSDLNNQMNEHLEPTEPTHEQVQEQISLLNRYFTGERRELIANYLDDRSSEFHSAEIAEQEEIYKSIFDHMVHSMFKLEDPIYITGDGVPIGKEVTLFRLLHMGDSSQNDLNLLETDSPIQVNASDVRDKIMTIMESRDDQRADRMIALFDSYVWSTVQRFLSYDEGQGR